MDKVIKKDIFFVKTKRIILTGLISVIVLLAALYIYKPAEVNFSKIILISTNQNSLKRFLSDNDKRDKWWATCMKAKLANLLNVVEFDPYYLGSVISVKMKIDDNVINGEMRIIPAGENSSYIKWQFDETISKNPVSRIKSILKRNAIEKNMQPVLFSLKNYTEKSENIYGCIIKKMKVNDTLLVVTKSILNGYPSTSYVYNQINRLRKYIRDRHVEECNFPMLYVQKTGKNLFETTISLPINKTINSDKIFVMQRMVPGDILYTECKGGLSAINQSFNALENYMQDYQKSSPALPFESLVTDRLTEQDTLKWITKVYYPIY